MKNLHREINARLVLRTTDNLIGEFRPELAAFLRHLQLGHLLEEVYLPLVQDARVKAAVAYDERPWPPAGVGARALRGFTTAVVSSNGQALATPVMLAPEHATNLGLAAALTKQLLEDLAEADIEWVSFFVNEHSKVVANELACVGFQVRQARVVSDGTSFVAHAARPAEALKRLGLADMRMGDVLALKVEAAQLSRLAAFHFSLGQGLSNQWAGRTSYAEVFPGYIDWVALPPAGITGTAGPVGAEPDPILILRP